MEFDDFEVGKTYFSVSDGQFMGVFYVIKKNEKIMRVLISYFGGDVDFELVQEEDLENDDEFEWMDNSFSIEKLPNDKNVLEGLRNLIQYVFEKDSNFVIKGWDLRR